tara:strand:- start:27400 stop:28998 length:1599 start_codon:yes stop_codon:yes gene_type:complete
MNKMLPYQHAAQRMSLAEKVGQLFMPAAFINDSEEEIQHLETLIQEFHIGSLCFFHSRASAATNFEGKKEVIYNADSWQLLKQLIARYQKAAKYPLLIAIDAEWGLAMRVENTPQYPYAITQGALLGHTDQIFKIGKNIARDCRATGIHWNLAPVVDINNNPNNPVIGYRSYGESKEQVAEKAIAYSLGMHSEGILDCLKHFPGHGDTDTDSHLGMPLINKTKEELWENELYPFRQSIANGTDAVMVGHLAVPALSDHTTVPATISADIIQGLLREEMQFKGVVISDALNMKAISKLFPEKGELEWQAFNAGTDVLCFSEHVSEGVQTILQRAGQPQIEESFKRVWALKEKAFKTTWPKAEGLQDPDALNRKLAYGSLSLLRGSEKAIQEFGKKDFLGVSIGQDGANGFFNAIGKSAPFPTLTDTMERLDDHRNILLAIFPPRAKPAGDFGLTQGDRQLVNQLLRSKNVVLYHFGNPYSLPLFNWEEASAVVLAYQNFEVFQQHAAHHFLGKVQAQGKIPVTLDQQPCESIK